MSDLYLEDVVILRDRLMAVRQAVDEALRVLNDTDGPPPLPVPASRPAAELCDHAWQTTGSFGGPAITGRVCGKCGHREAL